MRYSRIDPRAFVDPRALMQRFDPAQIAREITSVQPIDPAPWLNLYNALRPTPEFPYGRVLVFTGRMHESHP
jgi:hypothetical protein